MVNQHTPSTPPLHGPNDAKPVNPWRGLRLCLAVFTAMWALAWTLVMLFYISRADAGPPGHGRVGVAFAAILVAAMWAATICAAAAPRFGGVMLIVFGVLVQVVAFGSALTLWLAAPAVVLGLAAAVTGMLSRSALRRA